MTDVTKIESLKRALEDCLKTSDQLHLDLAGIQISEAVETLSRMVNESDQRSSESGRSVVP